MLQVVQIKLLNSVRRPLHLEHIRWVHSASHWGGKVLCKLFAVNGRRHQNDLGGKKKKTLETMTENIQKNEEKLLFNIKSHFTLTKRELE